MRWVMASVKNTRSKLAPRTASLYWVWYVMSLSLRKSKPGICERTSGERTRFGYDAERVVKDRT